jgi:uncharacterized protein (TIGR00661 family)
VENLGHYTVYLPAFSDEEILKILRPFSSIRWEVFSKYCNKSYQSGSLFFSPVSLDGFNKSFVSCKGILCTAGFETPAEALFMGKKLCVIPMKRQYEQACNAAVLAEMAVSVIYCNTEIAKKLTLWLSDENNIKMNYPERTREIIQMILRTN